MSQSDLRFSKLSTWLAQFFNQPVTLDLLCGDASFRRYFRLTHNGKRYIVADSPIELVPIAPFIAVADAYQKAGVLVPEVIHFCAENGFILQTDVGDKQLLSQLTPSNVTAYYQQALMQLIPLSQVVETTDRQVTPPLTKSLPIFDAEFVMRELTIFTEWLIGALLHYQISSAEQAMLNRSFKLLIDNVEQQPKVGMHRDFHSRNLMINHDQDCERLAIIDFQDAVVGPISYDAVSLLRDCYVRWPDELVQPLIRYHFELLKQHQLLNNNIAFSTYQQWFDLMGLQRHIKAAGIFARLKLRDGKTGYMKDIPLTLEYIIDIAAMYPQLTELSQWVKNIVFPKVQQAIAQVNSSFE
ncbi:aminoglycoside phosphotransferase family protein [Shewanella aestuarii]|uniref:Phosphotransferase n=1 Tax=Shewanella aestuarii TaxID=1028752 RepID=A0A6G9QGU9_9GAMM|nr:phosphotransferase [Shewanella aestuarii]QIR13750.1 phosphotransferase [Shewanella aestuarii]